MLNFCLDLQKKGVFSTFVIYIGETCLLCRSQIILRVKYGNRPAQLRFYIIFKVLFVLNSDRLLCSSCLLWKKKKLCVSLTLVSHERTIPAQFLKVI